MEQTLTVHAIITKYLSWCAKHRSPRTLEWYAGYLDHFLAYLGEGKDMAAMDIKAYHVVEWIDAQTGWGENYIRGAIVAVQRAYNWGCEMGHLDHTPLRRLKKPAAKRREVYTTPDDFHNILASLSPTDPFRDIFIFSWHTGARPQECRHIEPRHVELENERIIFPAEESKGRKAKRIIYLHGPALEIIERLMSKGGSGKLFLNNRGVPWSKFAICNRMYRYSKKFGKRIIFYGNRHGFATRKLLQGHGALTIGQILGHADGSMVAKVYGHLDKNADFLKKALAD